MAERKESVIIGLGQTGYSCARHFHARGEPFVVMDHSPSPALLAQLRGEIPDAPVVTGALDLGRMLQAERLVVSPGVPLTTPEIREAMDAGVAVTGDIDLFSRSARHPIIAVTGSNGKSTVTTLLGEMARTCGIDAGVGGNLGPPALDLLEGNRELYILEISSFQLETARELGAEVAVLLNLTPDHLDRYDSAEEYYAAKARICSGCRHAVVARDVRGRVHPPAGATVWTFTPEAPAGDHEFGLIRDGGRQYLARGDQRMLDVGEMVLRGHHNYLNALAALASASAAGWSLDGAREAVKEFRGLAHRCEWVAAVDGVEYVNDSKATNVGAALAALLSWSGEIGDGRIVLIAGGVGKGADFTPLVEAAAGKVRAAILMGEDADVLGALFRPVSQVHPVREMVEAVATAHRVAKPGDVVLLSPACASLDMYRNFEERGDRFKEAVLALAADGGARP